MPAGNTTDPKNEAFPEPTDKAKIEARAEGVKDAIRESTKDAFKSGADQLYAENDTEPPKSWAGSKNIHHMLDWLELPLDELKGRIGEKGGFPITEAQIAGLLEAERSGKNRTDFVKAYCDRLKIKSPYEATDAGPNYTNDTTNISEIARK